MDSTGKEDEKTQAKLRQTLELNDKALSDNARSSFQFYIDIFNRFKILSKSLLSNDKLSPLGRHMICFTIERDFTNCKQVLNYAADHHLDQSTSNTFKALIIASLPRTGTTLLFNLLACDPASRAPRLTDLTQPIPPISRSNTEEQTNRARAEHARCRQLEELGLSVATSSAYEASHPILTIEEDTYVLDQAGLGLFFILFVAEENNELLYRCLDDSDKDSAYAYHSIFYQVLNSADAPHSHWVLKGPDHSLYFNALFRRYPNAHVIMTHRRLDHVLPSFLTLTRIYSSMLFNEDDLDTQKKIIDRALNAIDVQIRRILEFRRNNTDKKFFDIQYDHLIQDPIGTIRRLYDYFHLNWSDEFENAMKVWLKDNPQGKRGRNEYTADDCPISSAEINQRYQEYNEMFLGH